MEAADWSIKWDGKYITENLPGHDIVGTTAIVPKITTDQIVHFGSINTFANKTNVTLSRLAETNELVFSWFLFELNDDRTDFVTDAHEHAAAVHAPCPITAENLRAIGIPDKRITTIPLGVDTSLFRLFDSDRRQEILREENVPSDAFVIGSFQNDGEGWGDGMEPKLVKGPDVLVETATRVNENRDVFVFLSGPARGYVKEGLRNAGVPFEHVFVKAYRDMVRYYNLLDTFLITSRSEGGPKAVLESMATGVPIVSTRVGLAPDVLTDGHNGRLIPVEDTDSLVEATVDLIDDPDGRETLAERALDDVRDYDWMEIAKQNYERLYRPLQP